MEQTQCEHVLEQRNLDSVLGLGENREINEYFGIYRIIQLVVGGSSSGKTTSVINAVMQGIYGFEHIMFMAPLETLTGEGILAKFIDKMLKSSKYRNKVHLFNISDHKLPTFEDLVAHRKKIKGKTLLIIDDWINAVNKKELNLINRLMCNSSRLSMDMILMLQNSNKVPPAIFQNATILSLFPCYLAKSQFIAMVNRSGVGLSNQQINQLLIYCKSKDNKRLELTINNIGEYDKQIRFDNEYITFN